MPRRHHLSHHSHSTDCDLLMRRGGSSVIGNCCLQPIPVGSTFPCCSVYVPDSTWEDLRDWQTLIRDFEIGVTRCQTPLAHSDSLSQSSSGVGWWGADRIICWSNLLILTCTKISGFSTFDMELIHLDGQQQTPRQIFHIHFELKLVGRRWIAGKDQTMTFSVPSHQMVLHTILLHLSYQYIQATHCKKY